MLSSPTATLPYGGRSSGEAPKDLPTFADGARAAAIPDAMLDSADNRSWVSVPGVPCSVDAFLELVHGR
jgi:hypothetical protein